MGRLTFITGPVRSGKSHRAVEQAKPWGADAVFVATYCDDVHDMEMMERVRRHRAQRPPWRTLEAPTDVAASLAKLLPLPSGAIVDCLTLWLSARFADSNDGIAAQWGRQLAAFREFPWPTIVVSNEVGWSLVPPDASARRFRDLAGTLAQSTAALADEAWLLVAGCAIRLK